MKAVKTILPAALLVAACISANAQTVFVDEPGYRKAPAPENSEDRVFLHNQQAERRRIVRVPNIPGYLTLKCDFHIHTIYADAEVYPRGRVREAWADGLDVMAMTEHIGTFKNEIEHMTDQNLPWRIAAKEAKKYGIIVVHGAEITRDKPFGHMNALFVNDCNAFSVNKYAKDEKGEYVLNEKGWKVSTPETVASDLQAVRDQGAFLLWNHPGWPDKKCDFYTLHKQLLDEGLLKGVEICNHSEWYPKVLKWFDEFHIPMFANTDAHNPTNLDFGRGIRPMTLVLAKEFTEESLKEAMFAGRTIAFFDNKLAGDVKWVEPLVKECLQVRVIDKKKGLIEVSNLSDIEFQTTWGEHMAPVIFYPGTAYRITLKKGVKIDFLNCYIGTQTLKTALW